MKQILNNISRITLSIMGSREALNVLPKYVSEGRGVGLLLMTLVMMAMSPQKLWADSQFTYTATSDLSSTFQSAFSSYGTVTCDTWTDANTAVTVTVAGTVTSIGNSAFYFCNSLTSITIPEGLTSIGEFAFCNCYALTSITIPSSVTSIGGSAFYDCSCLESITVAEGNTAYKSEDNCLLTKDGLTLITGCKNSVIPSGVTNNSINAFHGCTGLTSITIPKSVTSIQTQVFERCSNLTTITVLSSNATLGYQALNGCDNLKTIYVPAGSVETYKAATNWSDYADKIKAIPTLAFDLAITKAGATEATLSKELVKTITINKSAAGATQVKAQSGSEEVTPTALEHLARYDFTITKLPVLQPGEDVLEGDIVAKAKRRVATAATPPSVPTLNDPALVVGTATAYTTYPLDAENTDIKVQMLTNGNMLVNNTEVEGVTSIYFVDAHQLTAHPAVAATCVPGNSAYWSCSACGKYYSDAECTREIKKDSWVIPPAHNYVNGICTRCGIINLPATISIAEDGYYLLSTAADLDWFRYFVNFSMTDGENTTYPYAASNARLMADIDMSSICSSTTQSWEPIGKSSAYLGTFDGNNHELRNIYINANHDNYGFIGQLGNTGEATPACVKNLTISGSITSTNYNVGAIAATAQNAEITNCHNKANIKGYEFTGGIVGYHDAGSLSITKSSNSGNIQATYLYAGGIVGYSYGSSLTLEECNNSGSITATSDCSGGLAGYIVGTATIAKSCNTGSVTGGYCKVGGLVGYAFGISGSSALTNCYNTGTVKITNPNKDAYVGGIFGHVLDYTVNNVFSAAPVIRETGVSNYGAFAGYNDSSTFDNCYYDNEKADCGFNDVLTPSGNNGGKTTAEFASGEMTFLLNGNTSDGTLVWYQVIGGDATPTLEGNQYCIVKYDASNGYYNDIENLASLEFVDGTVYSINRERTATSLTYTRTFGGTNWTTWYVPFDLTLTDEICAKYYFSRINNVHQYEDENGNIDKTVIESFRQKSGTTLKANYPYLVRAKSDADKEMTLNLTDVTLKAAAKTSIFCQSVDTRYTFTGTYTGVGDGVNASTDYSLFDDDTNGWERFYTLKPQRHYLTITSRDGGSPNKAPRRIVLEVDEETTGIDELRAESLELRDAGAVYNLNGQRLAAPHKGINIINGKKVLVK